LEYLVKIDEKISGKKKGDAPRSRFMLKWKQNYIAHFKSICYFQCLVVRSCCYRFCSEVTR
jgi:hypothetical protein